MKSLATAVVILMLAGATFAEVFYEDDFTTDPFTAANPWTKVISGTGGSSAAWSSGYQALWVYSPDKTSQANVYSPTISGQGTEYVVSVQFRPSYTGTSDVPTSDNFGYILEPMTTAGSQRDITIALAYTSGIKDPKLAIRSTVGADTWAWSYQDVIFPLTVGTIYEVKYERTEGSNVIQAWARTAGSETWTQLKDSLGNDFTIVGGQSASSTFDKFHGGWANIASRYQFYMNSVSVTSVVPEPATMALLGLGGMLAVLRKRK